MFNGIGNAMLDGGLGRAPVVSIGIADRCGGIVAYMHILALDMHGARLNVHALGVGANVGARGVAIACIRGAGIGSDRAMRSVSVDVSVDDARAALSAPADSRASLRWRLSSSTRYSPARRVVAGGDTILPLNCKMRIIIAAVSRKLTSIPIRAPKTSTAHATIGEVLPELWKSRRIPSEKVRIGSERMVRSKKSDLRERSQKTNAEAIKK